MHPILLSLGEFAVHTYGFLVAVGFAVGLFYLSYQTKNKKKQIITQDDLFSLLFYTIICAIVGARIMFVIVEFSNFQAAPLDVFKIWQGGLVYYGGFIGSVLFFVLYVKKKKLNFAKLSDVFAPAIALGHFFGRLGCFSAGCCHGRPSDSAVAVVFNDPNSLAAYIGIPLLPTQLYEAFGNLILFVILHFYNKKSHIAGRTFAFYLIGYAVLRFIVEFFRGDYRGASILGFSVSQVISMVLFVVGLLIIYWTSKNENKN